MLNRLREVVEKRQELYMDLVHLQDAVENADAAIKQQLIEMNAIEALTIQWGKLRRMVRKD